MHHQHQPRNGEALAKRRTSRKGNLLEHAVPMITEGLIPNAEKETNADQEVQLEENKLDCWTLPYGLVCPGKLLIQKRKEW